LLTAEDANLEYLEVRRFIHDCWNVLGKNMQVTRGYKKNRFHSTHFFHSPG